MIYDGYYNYDKLYITLSCMVCRSHIVLQCRGSQQRYVLCQSKFPRPVERRGRMFIARQEDIQRHKPDTIGLCKL